MEGRDVRTRPVLCVEVLPFVRPEQDGRKLQEQRPVLLSWTDRQPSLHARGHRPQEEVQVYQVHVANENILHTCVNIDEYAGVIEREEKRQREEASGNLNLDTGSIDSAIDVLDKVDPYTDAEIEKLAKQLVDKEGISEENATREARRLLAKKKKAGQDK
jgi:hypothetical protein